MNAAKCSTPPELTDAELLAHLDGEPAMKTAAHLEGCAYCASRLEQLRRGISRLRSAAYRTACPPSMDLTAYHLGEISPEEGRRIHDHLQICAECRREIAHFRRFLESTGQSDLPEAGLIARSGILLADRLVPAVGLRGDGRDAPLVFQAGDLQVTLSIFPEGGPAFLLAGLLTGGSAEGWTGHLWRGQNKIGMEMLDSSGEFSFSGLRPGDYSLILDGVEREVHIPEFRI